jgi:hypothetical protein
MRFVDVFMVAPEVKSGLILGLRRFVESHPEEALVNFVFVGEVSEEALRREFPDLNLVFISESHMRFLIREKTGLELEGSPRAFFENHAQLAAQNSWIWIIDPDTWSWREIKRS